MQVLLSLAPRLVAADAVVLLRRGGLNPLALGKPVALKVLGGKRGVLLAVSGILEHVGHGALLDTGPCGGSKDAAGKAAVLLVAAAAHAGVVLGVVFADHVGGDKAARLDVAAAAKLGLKVGL